MKPPLTTAELTALLETVEGRAAKVPEGPWFVGSDPAADAPDHENSGLALVDTGRSGDWWIARLCEWPTAEFIAHSREDIASLCAAVRQLLADREAEMERESKLVTSLEEMNAALRAQLAEKTAERDSLNAENAKLIDDSRCEMCDKWLYDVDTNHVDVSVCIVCWNGAWVKLEAARGEVRDLKLIVDVGTNDDPGTALAKLHKIEATAVANFRVACNRRLLQMIDHKTTTANYLVGERVAELYREAQGVREAAATIAALEVDDAKV